MSHQETEPPSDSKPQLPPKKRTSLRAVPPPRPHYSPVSSVDEDESVEAGDAPESELPRDSLLVPIHVAPQWCMHFLHRQSAAVSPPASPVVSSSLHASPSVPPADPPTSSGPRQWPPSVAPPFFGCPYPGLCPWPAGAGVRSAWPLAMDAYPAYSGWLPGQSSASADATPHAFPQPAVTARPADDDPPVLSPRSSPARDDGGESGSSPEMPQLVPEIAAHPSLFCDPYSVSTVMVHRDASSDDEIIDVEAVESPDPVSTLRRAVILDEASPRTTQDEARPGAGEQSRLPVLRQVLVSYKDGPEAEKKAEVPAIDCVASCSQQDATVQASTPVIVSAFSVPANGQIHAVSSTCGDDSSQSLPAPRHTVSPQRPRSAEAGHKRLTQLRAQRKNPRNDSRLLQEAAKNGAHRKI